jgi:hypothetical protein
MGLYQKANRYSKPAKRKTLAEKSLMGVKEADVLNAVRHWLAARQIPFWRINSGGLPDKKGRYVRFGAAGMADIIAISPEGKFIAIECKRLHGGRLTDNQEDFLNIINAHGGIGIVVSSIESLELQLKEAGVI